MTSRRSARTTVAVIAFLAGALCVLVPAAPAAAVSTLTVTPDTGVSGGQDVAIVASGFEPGHLAGWCQAGGPVGGPGDSTKCGDNTISTQTVDASGQISGVAHLQRFIYVPFLSRWVDCADPAETCGMGAADAADVAGTAAGAPLAFATPPEPPATRGTIDVQSGVGGLTVTGTGFRSGAVVDVFECATGADHPSACGFAKATATAGATGGFQVTVTPDPFIEPAGGQRVDCVPFETEACSIVAAEAVDFPGTNVGVPVPVPPPPVPKVLPGLASVVEGNSGTVELQVPVTLSEATTNTVTVPWTTGSTTSANPLVADPVSDFTPASGTVTFAPDETAKTVSISVHGDVLVEPDEWIVVSFNHPTHATIGGYYGLGLGKITNDDHAVVLPGGASVVEGNAATVDLQVPVTLSNPSGQTITVQWSTLPLPDVPPRADSATDFTPASGTVTFAPGETAKAVTIGVNGDVVVEPNEWIVISFKHPTNATMGGFYGLGFGVIINDD